MVHSQKVDWRFLWLKNQSKLVLDSSAERGSAIGRVRIG